MAAQQAPGPAPLRGGALVLLTAGVALATFMEVLDISIVNVSVRTISGELGVSYDEGTMAITAYSLGSAIMQPLTGWIARRLGEVKTFSFSVLLFVLCSTLCGLSSNMNMLIVFRLAQGVVSGPMVPLSQTLLLNNYPPQRRSIAMALWAMTVVVAPVFGPVLGGWISDNYHWSWIFFLNIPVGLFTVIVAFALLRSRESKTAKTPVDVIGLGLLAVGVGSLQFLLDKGNDYDWFSSQTIVILSVTSLVCLTFLIAWELMHKNPVVNLRLFQRRNFAVGVACLSLGMFAFFGGTVVLPTWLQQSLGYNATWAGFAVAPIGLPAILLSPLVGSVQNRFDLRLLNTIGFLIFAACSFWMASSFSGISYGKVALPRLVMGMGIALFFVPVNQIILSGLRDEEVAGASGISNFCRTLAGSISTAVSTTMFDHRSTYHHAMLSEHTHEGGRATAEYLDHFQALGIPDASRYAALNQVLDVQAGTLALNDVFWGFGLIFGLAMVLIWLAKPPFASAGPGGH